MPFPRAGRVKCSWPTFSDRWHFKIHGDERSWRSGYFNQASSPWVTFHWTALSQISPDIVACRDSLSGWTRLTRSETTDSRVDCNSADSRPPTFLEGILGAKRFLKPLTTCNTIKRSSWRFFTVCLCLCNNLQLRDQLWCVYVSPLYSLDLDFVFKLNSQKLIFCQQLRVRDRRK